MEPDRYQENHVLYILGMLCLSISLSLLLFSFFTLPYLLFGWHYEVPGFIISWREWLVSNYGLGLKHASWLISLILFIVSFLFGIGAYSTSMRIDNAIYGIDNTPTRVKDKVVSPGVWASIFVLLQIIAIVAALYVGLRVIEALILNLP